MMQLKEATFESVQHVAVHMRDDDLREFLALSVAETREDLADDLAARFGERPEVVVAWDGAEPVAVGAPLEVRPNVVTLLFFASEGFYPIARPLTRWIKQDLFPSLKAAGVHRIECVALADHDEARRWIVALGLRPEGPPLRGYGKGGETYQQFAWVSDACPLSS